MTWDTLPFGRVLIDRAAHRRTDDAWLDQEWTIARLLAVDPDGQVLINGQSRELVFLSAADFAGLKRSDAVLLGVHAGITYFAVRAPIPDIDGAETANPRTIGAELDGFSAALLVEALAVLNWRDRYRFSPRSGEALDFAEAGWQGVGADPTDLSWPRSDPAVIVLINDGVPGPDGRCLLGRNANWPEGRYSCLAGFVEPGESAEAAVIREVAEESGVTVHDIRYVASQPWPFPASLMLGFTALADPDQPIDVADDELEEARWFTRAELLSRHGTSPLTPSTVSIAYHLITSWRDEPSL